MIGTIFGVLKRKKGFKEILKWGVAVGVLYGIAGVFAIFLPIKWILKIPWVKTLKGMMGFKITGLQVFTPIIGFIAGIVETPLAAFWGRIIEGIKRRL